MTQAYLGSLWALAGHHYAHRRYTRLIQLLERAIRLDNLQEDMQCQVLRAYAALGDRAGLISQYHKMKRVLAKELDMEPLPETEKLYKRPPENFKNWFPYRKNKHAQK